MSIQQAKQLDHHPTYKSRRRWQLKMHRMHSRNKLRPHKLTYLPNSSKLSQPLNHQRRRYLNKPHLTTPYLANSLQQTHRK